MATIRVHELAKELGVDYKAIIAKAQEIGIPGKKSHSSSLSGEELDSLRHAMLREALGTSEKNDSVKTKFDAEKGTVEQRRGNVIRRRKQSGDEIAAEAAEPVQSEAVLVAEAKEEAIEVIEVEAEAEVEVEAPPVVPSEPELADLELDVATVPYIADGEPSTTAVGPKILGRITLAVKPKIEKTVKPIAKSATKKVVEEDDEEEKRRAKKVKKVEFNRGDLLDYDGRINRKLGKTKGNKKHEDIIDDPAKTTPKASKRVIKMQGDVISVGELASQMSLKAGEVITKLIKLGVMATINKVIDRDTATIVADEFSFTIEFTGFDEDNIMKDKEEVEDPSKLVARPPVVTVMGHVDHGKTSLLDRIRRTTVAAKEHGGITQHIGAYEVITQSGKQVTFIDTPGHAAFTAMRARGANVTDIVILVVASDDGVMPQTIEAINHAKSANVAIVVAINKMDKPDANPDRVKMQLAEHGVNPEEWGGDTIFVPVSATSGMGIEQLLESILLVAEMKELKSIPDCLARGRIIEVRQEIGRGTVATILVQKGTLRVGDIFVCGSESGRVRSMMNASGARMLEAGPSMPVEITGLAGTPSAGDDFVVVEDEASAREVAEHRREIQRKKELAISGGPISLEEFSKQAGQAQAQGLCVIVKADVHGSLEAVKQALEQLSTDEVKVRIVHGAVGGVNESDIQLAIASKAIVVGFGVRGEPRVQAEAENHGIEVRYYRVIYELIDDIKSAMGGLLAPTRQENNLGRVEVRDTFTVPKIGTIAGCYVLNGSVKRGANLRLLRDSRVIHEGKIDTLRRFKDDVKEVQSGYECGMSIDGYNDVKVGDVIEVYEVQEIARTLD